MNWDNQNNKDPWGGKNEAPDFDDLMKKFSSILGGKKSSSNGSGDNSGGNGGFKMPIGRVLSYAFFWTFSYNGIAINIHNRRN